MPGSDGLFLASMLELWTAVPLFGRSIVMSALAAMVSCAGSKAMSTMVMVDPPPALGAGVARPAGSVASPAGGVASVAPSRRAINSAAYLGSEFAASGDGKMNADDGTSRVSPAIANGAFMPAAVWKVQTREPSLVP